MTADSMLIALLGSKAYYVVIISLFSAEVNGLHRKMLSAFIHRKNT
jgi:hypothetical protein